VSQPWETLACSPVRNAYLQQHSHMQLRAAGVSQPWCATVSARSTTLACASASRNHGGLTPAALDCAFASRRTMFDCRGTAVGLPNHGGLTPTAFVHVRFCIAKIVFSPANVRSAPRAGGVSPPWFRKRACKCVSSTLRTTFPQAHPGGLTPAALGCVFASRWTMFDSRGTAVGLPNHGGLTPAALANVRLCIANGALCGERMSCTRSGWRKPAVGNTGMLAGEKRISATTLAHAAKSGWRKPAVVRDRVRSVKNACVCKCVTEPRRADARRSWLCVRQPLDNVRFSSRGVRLTDPRRADTRRSWLCVRQPPDNVRFSRHNVRFTEPRRADTRRSWLCIR
jgi:hypothetical protein